MEHYKITHQATTLINCIFFFQQRNAAHALKERSLNGYYPIEV